MPFIPHTASDVAAMLDVIGADSIEALFDEIPHAMRCDGQSDIPSGLNEFELMQLMQSRARDVDNGICFIGAGAYDHHIPAAVLDLSQRGEFLTAYTPYQAEASQGALQVIYEYQTMIADLMGTDVANASLYDGATALAEAVLMALRLQKSLKKTILIPENLHPYYRETLDTILKQQAIHCVTIPFDDETGELRLALLSQYDKDIAALVIAQPNFLGQIETEVDALTDWVHEKQGLVIACVNPIAMSLLREPGAWGKKGADIICGEGQPLGVPLSSGGAYFGFMATRSLFVRQLPGRIVGRTVDENNKSGFTLTLQAREQHIRRAKATSNICTNQGLMVVCATIYMAMLGYQGLQQVASACHGQFNYLLSCLTAIPGVKRRYSGEKYCEGVIELPCEAEIILAKLAEKGIQGGVGLANYFSRSENCILVCATEKRTDEECEHFAAVLRSLLS